MSTLDEIIDVFQSVDPQMRLELLLDFSKRLPALPSKYQAERDAGLHRVPECETPVFLWVETDHGTVHIHVDVAEEAPTVKGFISILVKAFNGAKPQDLAQAPLDLLERLGLADIIRMNRAVGLAAILGRIKRAAMSGDPATSTTG